MIRLPRHTLALLLFALLVWDARTSCPAEPSRHENGPTDAVPSISSASPRLCGSDSLAGSQITIYRDRYGVPSVAADRLSDALYGLGYAMAQDNAERMARNYKQARGRMAEADGSGALLADGFIRSLGIEDLAQNKAASLTGEMAEQMQSFCDGANRALAEQKGRLPDWIEPFTPIDVLALAQLTNASFALLDIANLLLPSMGSNQFVVAPARTATGHAILSMDPHLDWDGILAWYEFAIYTKDIHFHGITLSGLPYGAMGHTDRVAWSMTNNSPSLFTFYTVQTNPANPKQYSYHGEWRDFEDSTIELRYREGGQLKSRMQRVRRTAWGPMLPFRSQAVKLSMLGSWDLLEESLRMARARDATQFREALRPLGLSMWNIVYADTQGHIGYQYNARVAHREDSFDWSKPVPGADSRTKWGPLWSLDELPHIENPRSHLLVNCNSAPSLTPIDAEMKPDGWPSYVTSYGHTTRYDRLSSLLANDSRLTIDRAMRYATDTLVPYAHETVAALKQAHALSKHTAVYAQTELPSRPGMRISLQQVLRRVARSAVYEPACSAYEPVWAQRFLEKNHVPRTLCFPESSVVRFYPQDRPAADTEVEAALKVLTDWNDRADVDSKGCGLFFYWLQADRAMPTLARKAGTGARWTADEQAAALAALGKAATDMRQQHGRLDLPWGDMHFKQRGDQAAPSSGFAQGVRGETPMAAVVPNMGASRDGKVVCTVGSSFRMIVHLDPKGVRSWSILPYGDSQDPRSPHYADQMALHGRGEYKDTYFGLDNIRKHAVSTMSLERK